jgi:hypothetical protein
VDILTSETVGKTLAAGAGAIVPSVAERPLPPEAQRYVSASPVLRSPEASALYAEGFNEVILRGGGPDPDDERFAELVRGLSGVGAGLADPHLRGFRTAGGLVGVALLWAGSVLEDPELRRNGKRFQEFTAAVAAAAGGRLPEAAAASAALITRLEIEDPDDLQEVMIGATKTLAKALQGLAPA